MTSAPVASLQRSLEGLLDPRARRGKRFALPAVLAFAVCAMADGARSLYAVNRWGKRGASPALLAGLGMTRATPSVATLFRVLGAVDRPRFEAALPRWARAEGVPAGAHPPGLRSAQMRVAAAYVPRLFAVSGCGG